MPLKGYWRLDSNSNDGSGNGFNGSDTNVSYVSSDAGFPCSKTATFLGTGRISVARAAALEPSTNGSLYANFNISSLNGNAAVIAGIDNVINVDTYGYLIWYAGGITTLYYEFDNAATYNQQTKAVAKNAVPHRACIGWDASYIYQALDGDMTSVALPYSIAYNGRDFVIGGDSFNGTRGLTGTVALVSVLDEAPTPATVKTDYAYQKGLI